MRHRDTYYHNKRENAIVFLFVSKYLIITKRGIRNIIYGKQSQKQTKINRNYSFSEFKITFADLFDNPKVV